MLVLGESDVREALPMPHAVELMKRAFASLARGEATTPPRSRIPAPAGEGVTLVMPARIDADGEDRDGRAGSRSLAVKVVSVFDDNPRAGFARIQGVVMALDPETGRPLALLEGSALTAIRTAAASGAATDLLARPDATQLAILGAGVQARSHIEAMCAVRPIAEIRVYSPTADSVDALIEEIEDAPWRSGSISLSRADSAPDALRDADIICTTTTSPTPVFDYRDVKPGAHINAVGSFTPDAREIPGTTIARAWVVVDEREAAWMEAGDLILARDDGLIDTDHIRADLGELVLEPKLRPDDPEQPTLFKSVGIAVQDAVAAAAAVERAKRRGLGTEVTL